MPITFVLKPSLLFFLCLFYVLSLYPFVFSFLLFLLSETSYDVFVFRKWQTTHFFFVRSLTNIAVHFSDKASNTGNIAKAKE